MRDWLGSGEISTRETAERIIAEAMRRIKLEARNDQNFVPANSDASTILAARHFVLPVSIPERPSTDANDVLAGRVFSKTHPSGGSGTPDNIPNTLVQRDDLGDFAASMVQVESLRGTAHAGYDFVLYAPDGVTAILAVPAGTQDVQLIGGRVYAAPGVNLFLANDAGATVVVIPAGTNDVQMVDNLDIGGVMSAAGGFVGNLNGNITGTAVAIAGSPVNVTGSRGGNVALTSFLSAAATLGLITDSTTP